jgi:hypothetical protein
VFGDALLRGEPAQQAGQLNALGGSQRGTKFVLVFDRRLSYFPQFVAALPGEVQRV